MKLYELAPTPSARRVSIFLAEKGIDIPRVNVDIRGGENLSPEFKAKSLNGRIHCSNSMMVATYVNPWLFAAI